MLFKENVRWWYLQSCGDSEGTVVGCEVERRDTELENKLLSC